MITFDAAHAAVHYPPDRRFRIWIRPSILIATAMLVAVPVLAAGSSFFCGSPHIPPVPQIFPNNFAGPHGFPVWVRYCHFFNFLFVTMLIRSGLSILADHPRLYFNNHCTPGSEWIRLTPITVPTDRIWTAKDDARYVSPLVATPGYGIRSLARCWHFLNVYGLLLRDSSLSSCSSIRSSGGASYPNRRWCCCRPGIPGYTMRHSTCRLSSMDFTATTRCSRSPILCCIVFGPTAILTGIAMSPAAVNRFHWYAKLFGGRQSARSIHFLTMLSFFAFIVVHVTLIVMTGFVRNMNHIVLGTDDLNHRE